MSNETYNYGECHACGEQIVEKVVNMDFWIQGNLIVVEDVQAGVCPQCSETIVNAANGQKITALLGDKKSVEDARKISVPVIS